MSESLPAPICVACKHCHTAWLTRVSYCISPRSPTQINLVTGDIEYKNPLCSAQRGFSSLPVESRCGKEGHWYDAKYPLEKEC